jgi:predicted nucleotidyltransferase
MSYNAMARNKPATDPAPRHPSNYPPEHASVRLTEAQCAAIRNATTECFGAKAEVWLFGSRVDDAKRGGDIDILINPQTHSTDTFRRKLRLLAQLERALGERKVDVIVAAPNDPRPIVKIARSTGVRL